MIFFIINRYFACHFRIAFRSKMFHVFKPKYIVFFVIILSVIIIECAIMHNCFFQLRANAKWLTFQINQTLHNVFFLALYEQIYSQINNMHLILLNQLIENYVVQFGFQVVVYFNYFSYFWITQCFYVLFSLVDVVFFFGTQC